MAVEGMSQEEERTRTWKKYQQYKSTKNYNEYKKTRNEVNSVI